MDLNHKKELFSLAYVGAIAAQVGLSSSVPNPDEDSIDLILKGKGYEGIIRSPQLDIQLKCTAKVNIGTDTLKYELPIKNYNELRDVNVVCPRYLFVLTVPKTEREWLTHDEGHAKMKHNCYWVSLAGRSTVANSTSITIEIPKTQILTAESLFALMQHASQRGVA